MHYVYHIHLTESSDLNEGYIGVSQDPVKRFDQHKKSRLVVGKAIRKYGLMPERNLTILASFGESESAYSFEKELRPDVRCGWNLGTGGLGGARWCSPETKLLLSELNSGSNNHFFGKIHSDESRAKISAALRAKDSMWRSETAAKAGKANHGKIRSPQSKETYSAVAMSRPKYTCPHCNKTGQYNSMIAHHGENCRLKNK